MNLKVNIINRMHDLHDMIHVKFGIFPFHFALVCMAAMHMAQLSCHDSETRHNPNPAKTKEARARHATFQSAFA